MRKSVSLAMVAAGWMSAASLLQGAPLSGFGLVARTPHFSFYSIDAQPVDPQGVEKYLVEVEQLLGEKAPAHADYYRYASPEQLELGTGSYNAGITNLTDGEIHSTEALHRHEIVHLVAFRLGRPGSFFQEGLAVAMGDKGKLYGQPVDRLAKRYAKNVKLADLVASFERTHRQVAYPMAGSFVANLIRRHGLSKVVEFFRACSGCAVGDAFNGTFGEGLEQAEATWLATL